MPWLVANSGALVLLVAVGGGVVHLSMRLSVLENDVRWIKTALFNAGFRVTADGKGQHD